MGAPEFDHISAGPDPLKDGVQYRVLAVAGKQAAFGVIAPQKYLAAAAQKFTQQTEVVIDLIR